ncbi:SRPBCC domain-containing protein [Chitinophaga horti]|uniref:SRPBCC domain-containing protein n=1 Tax=Chitinophaga horti TaxID=2920382 RepID=A0ABY6J7C3_9BACT|nr:SRPBCC domain-containing protein [Chitinophaga horti]UYQ95571.1 SRPBCC domain-containing protein [Chitinophaga horti]
MNKAIFYDFKVDKEKNKIYVDRSFNAPLDLVWAAWTEAEILDQWWAPKPYRAETKSMDFRPGGQWLYAMISPEGEKHWSFFKYDTINPEKDYAGSEGFCDENGTPTSSMPNSQWSNRFTAQGDDSTLVNIELQFKSLADLEALVKMGFKEGFAMGMENLDQYIAAQFYLRRDKKPNNQARTSFYVNFPGNTEEAFNFYKSVFNTDFVNGLQRFDQAPSDPNQPPMSDALKRMILHVELHITGGHSLMGTDAPKEMGFTVTTGNNMHINLEPSSREEADRLFAGLSAGGTVSMPLQEMFWGAYFGSFTDKYGINWMVNYQQK